MRIIKFYYTNGYCGGDIEECEVFPDTMTDDQIFSWGYEDYITFCEDYAYLAQGFPWEDLSDGDFADENEMYEAEADYYDNCEWGWNEITLDELKEWCEGHYGDFESRYEPQIKEMLEKEGK
jgi:hypothetical protein